MPNSAIISPSTPFPSRLLDDVMPTLSDTEWRLLCVIVRQTLGWEDGHGGRKKEDWLTQSQLKARTGRASEAVSRAIDGLVQKGIVAVRSESGEPLLTPQERRRCPGRMLFRLTPRALYAPRETTSPTEAPVQRAEATAYSLPEQGPSVSELRKTNTTKETRYKTTPGGVSGAERNGRGQAVENPLQSPSPTPVGRTTPRESSEVWRFLRTYQERFARESPRGEAPPIQWGRDGKLVKGLLRQYGYERLSELLERFFRCENAWVKQRGYALSCFPVLLPALLMEAGRTHEVRRRALAAPVVVEGPSARHWEEPDESTSRRSLFERFPDLERRVNGQSR